MKRMWVAGVLVFFLAGCTDYHIIKTSLGTEAQYTSNTERTYIVAGCVPKNMPSPGIIGSVWVLCNDLDYVKDKVIESQFVSCLDLMDNGVVKSIELTEVRNRKWKSFRFVCVPIQPDGTLGSATQRSPQLFNFSDPGSDFSTTIADNTLPLGILEVYNFLFQSRESLLQIGIVNQSADATYNNGLNGTWPANPNVSPRIPDASPISIGILTWQCPPGMVVTGAAVGHIPDKHDRWTRPVYLLGECRKLHKFAIL